MSIESILSKLRNNLLPLDCNIILELFNSDIDYAPTTTLPVTTSTTAFTTETTLGPSTTAAPTTTDLTSTTTVTTTSTSSTTTTSTTGDPTTTSTSTTTEIPPPTTTTTSTTTTSTTTTTCPPNEITYDIDDEFNISFNGTPAGVYSQVIFIDENLEEHVIFTNATLPIGFDCTEVGAPSIYGVYIFVLEGGCTYTVDVNRVTTTLTPPTTTTTTSTTTTTTTTTTCPADLITYEEINFHEIQFSGTPSGPFDIEFITDEDNTGGPEHHYFFTGESLPFYVDTNTIDVPIPVEIYGTWIFTLAGSPCTYTKIVTRPVTTTTTLTTTTSTTTTTTTTTTPDVAPTTTTTCAPDEITFLVGEIEGGYQISFNGSPSTFDSVVFEVSEEEFYELGPVDFPANYDTTSIGSTTVYGTWIFTIGGCTYIVPVTYPCPMCPIIEDVEFFGGNPAEVILAGADIAACVSFPPFTVVSSNSETFVSYASDTGTVTFTDNVNEEGNTLTFSKEGCPDQVFEYSGGVWTLIP